MDTFTHITYLDTTGRPAVALTKKGVTDYHTGLIYVRLFLSPRVLVLILDHRSHTEFHSPRISRSLLQLAQL